MLVAKDKEYTVEHNAHATCIYINFIRGNFSRGDFFLLTKNSPNSVSRDTLIILRSKRLGITSFASRGISVKMKQKRGRAFSSRRLPETIKATTITDWRKTIMSIG